jgi:hypothetical protein
MAPPERGLRDTFRLLHSFVEKAHQLRDVSTAEADKRRADWLFRVEKLASDFLQERKREEGAAMTGLGQGLQVQLQMQQDLQRQLSAGQITRQEAEVAHKELQRRINAYRADIDKLNHVLRAQDSATLGGFIDLPLEDYARELQVELPSTPRELSPQAVNIRIAIAAGVIGIVAVLAVAWSVLGVPGLKLYLQRDGDVVTVQVYNNLFSDITLFAPWPDGAARQQHSDAYGLELHAQRVGSTRLEELPAQVPAWTKDGVPTLQQEPVVLPPGLDARIELDLKKVVGINPTETALEVHLTDGGGRVVAREQLNH